MNLLRLELLLEKLEIRDFPVTAEFFRVSEELCPRLRQFSVDLRSWSNEYVKESFRKRRPRVTVNLEDR